MEVLWTSRAGSDYNHIIGHLLEKWTKKEALSFISRTEKTVLQLTHFPSIGSQSQSHLHIRKSLITKQVTLYYTVKDETLFVLALWANLRDPSQLDL